MRVIDSLLSARRPLAGLAASAALWLGAPAMAAPERFVIDPEHFTVAFLVEHIGYASTLGMFREARGEFVYDEQTRELESGEVVIEAASVFSNNEDRDGHLRNRDFLDVGNHPEIRFEATEYEAESDHGGRLHGDLTLLGETRPIAFDVTINRIAAYPFGGNPYVLGASARTSIARSDFGMTYGLDGDLVGDRVTLILEFEAIRQ